MKAKKKTVVRLRGTLPYRIVPDEDWFIAKCELLHVNGQGKTKASAVRHLRDAIAAFLYSCVIDGTVHEILTECGFHAMRLGNETVWGSSRQPKSGNDRGVLEVRSRFFIPHAPPLPRSHRRPPTGDFPWIVALPETGESSRAA
jgi:predicted RNase H-like HicB family nuclease